MSRVMSLPIYLLTSSFNYLHEKHSFHVIHVLIINTYKWSFPFNYLMFPSFLLRFPEKIHLFHHLTPPFRGSAG